MPWFRCLIRGEQFPGRVVGESRPVGFFVTRFIEAPSATDAERAVIQALMTDPKLADHSKALPSSDARVELEEITVVRPDEVPPVQPGFAWHLM